MKVDRGYESKLIFSNLTPSSFCIQRQPGHTNLVVVKLKSLNKLQVSNTLVNSSYSFSQMLKFISLFNRRRRRNFPFRKRSFPPLRVDATNTSSTHALLASHLVFQKFDIITPRV